MLAGVPGNGSKQEIRPKRKATQLQQQVLNPEEGEERRRMDVWTQTALMKGQERPPAGSGGLQHPHTNAPLRDQDSPERPGVREGDQSVCELRPNWGKHTPADQETRFTNKVDFISAQK